MSNTKTKIPTDYWVLKTPISTYWIIQTKIEPGDYCYFECAQTLRYFYAPFLNKKSGWLFRDGDLIGRTLRLDNNDISFFREQVIVLKDQIVYNNVNSLPKDNVWLPKHEAKKVAIDYDKVWSDILEKIFSGSTQKNKPKFVVGADPYNGKDVKPFVCDEDGQFKRANDDEFERFKNDYFRKTHLINEREDKINWDQIKKQIRDTPIQFSGRKSEYVPYQLCPKCQGTGSVLPDNLHSTSIAKVTCNVCFGKMIIPMHKL